MVHSYGSLASYQFATFLLQINGLSDLVVFRGGPPQRRFSYVRVQVIRNGDV
jgi:hypothetical protein